MHKNNQNPVFEPPFFLCFCCNFSHGLFKNTSKPMCMFIIHLSDGLTVWYALARNFHVFLRCFKIFDKSLFFEKFQVQFSIHLIFVDPFFVIILRFGPSKRRRLWCQILINNPSLIHPNVRLINRFSEEDSSNQITIENKYSSEYC